MDSDFKKLDTKAEDLSKELVKKKTAFQHKKEILEEEQAKLTKSKKEAEGIRQDIAQNKGKVKADQDRLGKIESENSELTAKYKSLQKQMQDALAGIASEGVSDSATVADQIMGML